MNEKTTSVKKGVPRRIIGQTKNRRTFLDMLTEERHFAIGGSGRRHTRPARLYGEFYPNDDVID